MSTLRSLAFGGLWGLWTALFGLAIPLVSIAGSPPAAVRTLSRVWARGVLALLAGVVGLRHRERGREHVHPMPRLIVSNHQSTWETLAAQNIHYHFQSVPFLKIPRINFSKGLALQSLSLG